jgi:3-hydroxybutyryl-CoA dehydrogenase
VKPGEPNSVTRIDVKTIAVIGAGLTGRGIAYLAVRGGYKTVLEDVSDDRLEKASAWIGEQLDQDVAAIANISTEHVVEEAIRDADLVIETLPDEMEMKIELFTILGKFAKPGAIFASAGAISIAELAEVTFCGERCIGMRFAGPVAESKTVELVKTLETSTETIARCAAAVGRMGKDFVVVEDVNSSASSVPERKLANAQN